jgi:hypothetical protein
MKYRVKKRWTLLGVAMIAIIAAMIFSRCFLEVDYLGYQKVLERANPALPLETESTYKASQQKKRVQKAYWHSRGDQLLEGILTCSEAELVYEKEGEKQVIVEYMKGVRCLIQEELFYLSSNGKKTSSLPQNPEGYSEQQAIRYLVADSAKYHYTSETLEAVNVDLWYYTAPGHKLFMTMPENQTVKKSRAASVTLSFIEKTLKFKAEKLQGTY